MTLLSNARSTAPLTSTVGNHFARYGIVGQSRAIADVIERIELVSATRSIRETCNS